MKQGEIISIVVPCFNEEKNIEVLFNELIPVLSTLHLNYEIIFVDDGSKDNTFKMIRAISEKKENVRGISLSRNFGHQVAIMAGLQQCNGDIVIMMDADLQHPPEVIPKLLAECEKGFDIVNTRRIDSKDTGIFKKASSRGFYSLINFLSDIKIEHASADFRLLTRKAVDAFLKLEEKDRFTRGLISWMGFRQSIIEYNASSRYAGKSKYTLKKMLHFSIDGITSFSSKPLRISFYAGLVLFIFGFAYAVYAIIENINGKTTQGWTSLLVTVLIIGGFQLLSLGIIGEYIGRIFNQTKGRPMYFIKDFTKDKN
jgi:polyisoprenyl-phosphate glycosyltransferase